MKVALACVVLVALAHADVEQEVANERADITYRISFKTKDVPTDVDPTDAQKAQAQQFGSTGKFTIEIVGKDGTTGEQPLIDHPSMVKSDDGSWKAEPGMVQVAKFNAAVRIDGEVHDRDRRQGRDYWRATTDRSPIDGQER